MNRYEVINEELKRLHETLRKCIDQSYDIQPSNTMRDLRLSIIKLNEALANEQEKGSKHV